MPEIKIKHVVSFTSEDKVHKAENMLRSETYRKWKNASPGEKSASIVLQFEKATQIHSIDIGNECSSFVEVLVGRSSDTVNSYQVLLVASSFMSPLESRNEQHTNRVRMFGYDKLSQNVKDEKWDCVQVVCTQPFNKNITYGLSFIKFHSPPEKVVEKPVEKETKAPMTLGAFSIKYEDEDDDTSGISSWKERKNKNFNLPSNSQNSPSFAATVLASTSNSSPVQQSNLKRKADSGEIVTPPAKKEVKHANRENKVIKDIFKAKREDSLVTKQKQIESKASTSQKNEKHSKSFHKIMDDVVFVMSGFVNPLRAEIRDKALEMGAKYKGDWEASCTHLVCAFLNTPKYQQVKKKGGKIIKKDWIMDCHRRKMRLPWRDYMLGTSTDNSEEESEEDIVAYNVKKDSPKTNGVAPKSPKKSEKPKKHSLFLESDSSEEESLLEDSNKPKEDSAKFPVAVKDDSETEDEEALQDYMADTDVEDSGGDTEDEILKCEREMKRESKDDGEEVEDDSDSLLPSKVDTSDMPLPELPNLFKKRRFFLYGNFSSNSQHDIQRYIIAFNGLIEDYMSETVKYVITESKWDKNFEEALSENEDLIFVKPEWIFKCKESEKLVPYQAYIVTPDT